jgi:hypothetical protein
MLVERRSISPAAQAILERLTENVAIAVDIAFTELRALPVAERPAFGLPRDLRQALHRRGTPRPD